MRVSTALFIWLGVVFLALVAVIGSAVGTAVDKSADATIREAAREAAREEVRDTLANPPAKGTVDGTSAIATSKDLAQTVQAVVTTAALVVGGAWAYVRFVATRGFAGTVRIESELKKILVDQADRRTAVISVKVENVGPTQVSKDLTQIWFVPVTDAELIQYSAAMTVVASGSLIPPSVPAVQPPRGYPKVRPIFEGKDLSLEPGESAVEDVFLTFGAYHTAKIEVLFVGRIFAPSHAQLGFLRSFGVREEVRRWTSRRALSIVGELEEDAGESWV